MCFHGVKIIFPLKYEKQIVEYSKANKLDPHLVMAVIYSESKFNPQALSKKGAKGLMQLTDQTSAWAGRHFKTEKFDIYNPDTNIKFGCWYIRVLMEEFDSNMNLVLAAYNGGSGNVTKWLQNREYSLDGINLSKIPFKETELYVEKVNKIRKIYETLYPIDNIAYAAAITQ